MEVERQAVLRQLIGQLQELSQLHASDSLKYFPHGHNLFHSRHCQPNHRVQALLHEVRAGRTVSYDTDTATWAQLPLPLPPHLTDHTLAECGGRVMLAGLVTKNAATCLCIWELQRMTLLWKEVDRMPSLLCLEFYGKHVRMTCLGNTGLLMVSLRSRQTNRLVSYDMASREWLKVPGCVVPRKKKRQWIACGTAFYPCLTATA